MSFAVTGAGVLCPIAGDRPAFTRALAGSERATRIEAGLAERLTPHQARRLDRLAQILVAAGGEAATHARSAEIDPARVGLVVGTGLGCLDKTASQLRGIASAGLAHLDALGFPESMDNSPAAHAAIALRCHGPSFTVRAREISGEAALLLACRLLAAERADAVVVLAGDAPGEAAATALAGRMPAARLGEGAGALVVERLASALRRGAEVLATVRGFAHGLGRALAPLRFAERERIAETEARAAASAGVELASLGRVERECLWDRIGWCPADGVLRTIAGIDALSTSTATLVTGAARGGAVTSIVLARGDMP